MIILDIGSGNTIKNNLNIGKAMINEIAKRDTGKHPIVFKAQLFEDEPPNTPLNKVIFANLYEYARDKGYQMTSSVFDLSSLTFLLKFDIPFVKIACRPNLYWLIGEVPRKVRVWVSVGKDPSLLPNTFGNAYWMECVPKYPAPIEEYRGIYEGISDHTVGLDLFKRLAPIVWEKHLKLESSTGPDAGPFAVTPQDLEEIL